MNNKKQIQYDGRSTRRSSLLSFTLEQGIKEVRCNLDTLYRHNAIVLSDFDRLISAWKGEFLRTQGAFDFHKLLAAIDFASLKHVGQVRNHADWVPYLIHPMRVALALFSEGVVQEDLLITALLHDIFEDTRTLPEEIEARFGNPILLLVEELTELPGQAMADYVEKMSREARIVKLADRTHNLRDLIDHPPQIWRKDKVESFLERSRALLQALIGTHPELEREYRAALEALENTNQS